MAPRPTLSTSAGLGVGASAGLLSGLSLGRPVLMLVAGVVLAIAGRLGRGRPVALMAGACAGLSVLFVLAPAARLGSRLAIALACGAAAGLAVAGLARVVPVARSRGLIALAIVVAAMAPAPLLARDVSVRRELDRRPPAAVDRAEAYLRDEVRDARLPGLVFAVAHRGRPVRIASIGHADTALAPTSGDTPFLIGSMTKSFTALAVLQLAEQGRLALDDPIADHLPWLTFAGPGPGPTIRAVLHHASGIPAGAGWKLFAGADDPATGLADALADAPRLDPGTIEYSNANYVLLGQVIEAVTGTTYEAHLHRAVIEPLGLTRTTASLDVHDRARGYRMWFGVPVASDVRTPRFATPAGFVTSTAGDLLTYLDAMTSDDSPISASIRADTLDATVDAPTGAGGEPYPGQRYAMGWVRGTIAGREVTWHSGGLADFNSVMVSTDDREWSFVVLINTASQVRSLMPDITYNVLATLTGDAPRRPGAGRSLADTYLVLDLLAVALLTLGAHVAASTLRGLRAGNLGPSRRSFARSTLLMVALACAIPVAASRLSPFPVDATSPSDLWALERLLLDFVPDVAVLVACLVAVPVVLGAVRVTCLAARWRDPG